MDKDVSDKKFIFLKRKIGVIISKLIKNRRIKNRRLNLFIKYRNVKNKNKKLFKMLYKKLLMILKVSKIGDNNLYNYKINNNNKKINVYNYLKSLKFLMNYKKNYKRYFYKRRSNFFSSTFFY